MITVKIDDYEMNVRESGSYGLYGFDICKDGKTLILGDFGKKPSKQFVEQYLKDFIAANKPKPLYIIVCKDFEKNPSAKECYVETITFKNSHWDGKFINTHLSFTDDMTYALRVYDKELVDQLATIVRKSNIACSVVDVSSVLTLSK